MKEQLSQKIEEYILDCCEYQESLHSVLRGLFEESLFTDIRELVKTFMKLYNKGYIKIEFASEMPIKELIKITNFKEGDLMDYIKENKKDNFEKWPRKEYYIETTKAGIEYYEKNYSD